MEACKCKIIKKDGTYQDFDINKVFKAINKSAARLLLEFTSDEYKFINDYICKEIDKYTDNHSTPNVPITAMHSIVEMCLDHVNPEIAKSYRSYRDNIKANAEIMDKVYREHKAIMFRGDNENANADSALVSTKRALSYNVLNREMYKKFFLNVNELQAIREGYIYIHDLSARLDTMNCCLCDISEILNGGFDMGNMHYNEPKSIRTAFSVIGDVTLGMAGQQYGGFTLPQIDEVLSKYAEISYEAYKEEYSSIYREIVLGSSDICEDCPESHTAHKYAMKKLERDIEQGYQGWEYKFNTVASCRGDYPFITITLGHGTDEFSKLIAKTILKVHSEGQGEDGFKKPSIFPKIVFLYDKNIHGKDCECRDVYEAGIHCSSKTMYPDWLSLTGKGYVPEMFKKYGKIVSPMGCRAFLSPWYERGGKEPADENDKPVFIGRFNIGAVSLNLPMILAKSREENKDFYEVLDYYLDLIRDVHKKTYEYLGNMKASVNPLGFCQGGFYGGHLNPNDKILPLLKPMTASFGVTALEELQYLYNGKSLVENNEFALEVMKYINKKKEEFTEEDGILYAIYGTPAESLCYKQVDQFRDKYGIIKGVSDRDFMSNSFHCGVWENITPIQKQDIENPFWDLFNGGKIQYCRYPIGYNIQAIETLVDRAMEYGYYEGVNLALSYCEDCGYQSTQLDYDDTCPICGGKHIFRIDRVCGYLGVSRGNNGEGDSRVNKGKQAEIRMRVSM